MDQNVILDKLNQEKTEVEKQITLLDSPTISWMLEVQYKLAYLRGYLNGLGYAAELLEPKGPDDGEKLG